MTAHSIPAGETLDQAFAAEYERAIRDQFRDRRDWRELVAVPIIRRRTGCLVWIWRRLTGGLQ